MAYPVPTSATVASSIPGIKLGTRARDESGNEYIYVDFQAAAIEGEVFAISSTFTATDVTTATVGAIGLVCGTVSSDTCGWLQVYGTANALGSSLLVVGAVGLGDTSDGFAYLLPYTTALVHVEGLYIVAGSTATSADYGSTAASSTYSSQLAGLVTAQLNYPFISGGPHVTESS